MTNLSVVDFRVWCCRIRWWSTDIPLVLMGLLHELAINIVDTPTTRSITYGRAIRPCPRGSWLIERFYCI